MQRYFPSVAALCLFPLAGTGRAQDVVRVAPGRNKIILENAVQSADALDSLPAERSRGSNQ
jgi:hypothetical protein